jgi:hypothetical protein
VVLDSPASAQGQTTGLIGRAWVGTVGRYVLKDNEPFASPGFGTAELMVNGSGFGLGGDVEYKFSKWLGVDAALGYTKLNVDYTTSVAPGTTLTDRFTVVPLLFAINIHVVHSQKVDVWVGPQVGYVMFPDTLSYSVPGAGTFTYTPKRTFSPKGFVVGTDIGMTKTVAFNFAFRWQNADGDDNGNLTIDPTFVTFGIAKKF